MVPVEIVTLCFSSSLHSSEVLLSIGRGVAQVYIRDLQMATPFHERMVALP